MANIKEKELPVADSIESADYLRMVSSEGLSQLIKYDDLAPKAEKVIAVRVFTIPSRSYAANSTTWIYSLNIQVDEIDGFTPVGIMTSSPSAQSMLILSVMLSPKEYGRRLIGYVRNSSSSAITDSIALNVLYVNNNYLDLGE